MFQYISPSSWLDEFDRYYQMVDEGGILYIKVIFSQEEVTRTVAPNVLIYIISENKIKNIVNNLKLKYTELASEIIFDENVKTATIRIFKRPTT